MDFTYTPNKANKWNSHFNNTIKLDQNNKIVTLIWWNGSWKSTILETIFKKYIEDDNLKIIAFSSWQNELFSSIFRNHKKKNKKYSTEENLEIKSFYFDYSWVRFLVFFATTFKKEWRVRKYLLENNYIKLDENGNDISTRIWFRFRLAQSYINKILNEYDREAKWEFIEKLYRNTLYHKYLELFIQNQFDKDYDFLDNPEKIIKKFTWFNSKDFIDLFWNNINEVFTFLAHATNWWEYNIDLETTDLLFENYIEFKYLSDWEYQLLAIYGILDLFDSNDTVFLLDEVDSHLHYKNINKLWENLSSIQWKLITTTHIPDSIINNEIKQIKVVKDWIIDDDNTVNSLINRLWNISDTYLYEKKLASKVENIVLVDDCTDWFIFKELAKIKKWSNYDDKIEWVQSIKCNSWFNWNPNEIFWEKKLNWINEFILKNNSFKTKKIFSLCDKDECPIAKIDDDMKFKEYHTWDNKKTQNFWSWWNIYYLSWKRREIENYFLSYTLLNEYWLLDDVNNLLPPARKIRWNNSLDYNEIQVFQAKEVVQKFAQKELNWKFVWKDYTELKEIISMIPADEISEDIEKMYDFIISKI